MDNIEYEMSLKKQIQELISTNKPIILFGTKVASLYCKMALDFLNINIACYCDNDKLKQGEKIKGIEVLSPESAMGKYPNAKVFLCLYDSNNILQVRTQLEKVGFKDIYSKDILHYLYHTKVIQRSIEPSHIANMMKIVDEYEKNFILPIIGIPITEKCTLNCKNCSALISQYKNPKSYDKKEIIDQIKSLSKIVDVLQQVSFFGGEPLLHKDIVEICQETSKIKNVYDINISTNGTIIPSSEDLIKLKNSGVRITISNYKVCYEKTQEFIRTLEVHGIPYVLIDESESWYCNNLPSKCNRTQDKNSKLFKECIWGLNCPVLRNGKFYGCALYSTYMNLEFIEENQADFVDLEDSSLTILQKKDKLLGFINNTKVLAICDYCGVDFKNTCSRGIQY